MIRCIAIPWLLSVTGLFSAGSDDLLRFTNGDQLHGSFRGLAEGPKAVWLREDLTAPVEFDTTRIRHVVLHGGRPVTPLDTLCHVVLVNGDRIPGTITGVSGDTITVDTIYAGILRIPRRQVSMLSPNPLGGRVYYHGPFVEDEWKMLHGSFPEGLPAVRAPEESDEEDEADDDELPGRWQFSGASWYWQESKSGTALVREDGMPDRAMLRFELAWKNRLGVAIGFHSDFARPKLKREDRGEGVGARLISPGDSAYLPVLFGNSYVLQLHSNYLVLYRSVVDEDGKPSTSRVELNHSSFRLGDSGRATVELRGNRRSGSILLFIDGEFVAQWSEKFPDGKDGAGYVGKGAGFGFVVQGADNPVRISDVVISEWNGMPDSARSMQTDDQDVVLMANGTDRYAGEVGQLDDGGKLHFKGRHGSFEFPLDEVAEIRFAKSRRAAVSGELLGNMMIRLSPIGVISGLPVAGDEKEIGLVNPIIGDMKVRTESALMLDFNASNQFIDDWGVSF